MSFITTFLYQPFFNLLVGYFYALEQIPGLRPDMGVAVILLTLTIRVLLLPLTIASTRTKAERREIEETIKHINTKYSNNPVLKKEAVRKTFKGNRRVIISETIDFVIQLIIFFILYRIFTTGLEGEDMHLLYSFMPKITITHDALIFLGKFDLTHTNTTLNLIQSLTILSVEAISLIDSPFPTTRNEFIRYIVILPVASFLIFMFLPAGKKLFVITTLTFSFAVIAIRILGRWYQKFLGKWETIGVSPSSEVNLNNNPPINQNKPNNENTTNLR